MPTPGATSDHDGVVAKLATMPTAEGRAVGFLLPYHANIDQGELMAKVIFWEKPGCGGNARQKEILRALTGKGRASVRP